MTEPIKRWDDPGDPHAGSEASIWSAAESLRSLGDWQKKAADTLHDEIVRLRALVSPPSEAGREELIAAGKQARFKNETKWFAVLTGTMTRKILSIERFTPSPAPIRGQWPCHRRRTPNEKHPYRESQAPSPH